MSLQWLQIKKKKYIYIYINAVTNSINMTRLVMMGKIIRGVHPYSAGRVANSHFFLDYLQGSEIKCLIASDRSSLESMCYAEN